MPNFVREGIQFFYADRQHAADTNPLPFVWQHGIGTTSSQPLSLLSPPPASVRLLALDCRGHGQTTPLGETSKLCFDVYADDVIALLDHLHLQKAVIGGISMGAGIALNVAIRYPERVMALVLSHPAWLDRPMGAAGLYLQVYQYLVRFGIQGREQFVKTLSYQKIAQESPDAAQSLLRQFDEARAEDALERLVRLPQDSPLGSLEVLRSITVPTLVMASKQDLIHPVAYGRTIAGLIPYAIYEEVSSQSVDKEKHTAEVRQAIITFLQQQ